MKNINYKNLSEIIVKSQAELDAIPDDFKGRIYIEFGTWDRRAIVAKKFYFSVDAWGNSSVVARANSFVEARENSSVDAWENSSVVARDNSSVVARDNSSVDAWGNSSVVARGNSSVDARENSSVVARENSSVEAWDNSSVVALGNSSVEAWDNSFVEARDNSSVEAWGNSFVDAWGNSFVVARGNSSVEARGNVQVVNYLQGAKIKISGNVRIVYNPKTIFEFMDFYGINHTKTKAKFYKAVHKIDGRYISDKDNSFEYVIGKYKTNSCDIDVFEDCSYGIHISHLAWALDFGKDWKDLSIIEVETKIEDIVLPENSNGKVRTSKVKVIREVPLEECGIYGKILLKRRLK